MRKLQLLHLCGLLEMAAMKWWYNCYYYAERQLLDFVLVLYGGGLHSINNSKRFHIRETTPPQICSDMKTCHINSSWAEVLLPTEQFIAKHKETIKETYYHSLHSLHSTIPPSTTTIPISARKREIYLVSEIYRVLSLVILFSIFFSFLLTLRCHELHCFFVKFGQRHHH